MASCRLIPCCIFSSAGQLQEAAQFFVQIAVNPFLSE
jgi:hypothetical protein